MLLVSVCAQAWQHRMSIHAAEVNMVEQERMRAREAGWPSRVWPEPTSPSFNVTNRSAFSPMSTRQSDRPWSPLSLNGTQRGMLTASLPMPPRAFSAHPARRSLSPGSPSRRPQTCMPSARQLHAADMLRAGLPSCGAPLLPSSGTHHGQLAATSPKPPAAKPVTASPRAKRAQTKGAAIRAAWGEEAGEAETQQAPKQQQAAAKSAAPSRSVSKKSTKQDKWAESVTGASDNEEEVRPTHLSHCHTVIPSYVSATQHATWATLTALCKGHCVLGLA